MPEDTFIFRAITLLSPLKSRKLEHFQITTQTINVLRITEKMSQNPRLQPENANRSKSVENYSSLSVFTLNLNIFTKTAVNGNGEKPTYM